MTIREDRLQDLIDQYTPPDTWETDNEEELPDWALVEFDEYPQSWWITLHESAEDAGNYCFSSEGGWVPHILVNLDTGEEYTPIVTTTWKLQEKDLTS